MTLPALALLRRVLDPDHQEEILGDLEETLTAERRRFGRRRALARYWRSVADVCVRQSRAATWLRHERSPAAVALAALAFAGVLQWATGLAAFGAYTVHATDPAGTFTLSFRGAQVVAATLDGRAVSSDRLIQSAHALRIVRGDGDRDLVVELTGERHIRWSARLPREVR